MPKDDGGSAVSRVDLPLMRQAAPLATVDAEARTVEVVFSTAERIPHWMPTAQGLRRVPTQVMLTEEAADLSLLRAGAPVLDNHATWDSRSVVGVVEDAWIADGAARARLRFSATEEGEAIWRRVEEGVLRQVSMGAEFLAFEIEEDQGEELWRVTRWRPREISMVPLGADTGAVVQSGEAGLYPAEVRRPSKEAEMPEIETAGQPASTPEARAEVQTQGAGGTPAAPAPDAAEIRRQAAADERRRIAEIDEVAGALRLGDDPLVRQARESDMTADAFRAEAIRVHAQRSQEATRGLGLPSASVTADATERFRQGAVLGLLAAAGMPGGERNEFSGCSLADLARQAVALSDPNRKFSDPRRLVGEAFVMQAGAHSTSDFANILANVASKSALMGWQEAEETYQIWTRAGTLRDFKPARRAGIGLVDALPLKPEGAEYTAGTVGDRGEPITLATYGRVLKLTREAVINDDLDEFTRLPAAMGRAARRTIGNLVYAVLTGNPTMSDGTALFHADHGNLASSGGAPGVATLGAGRAAMRTQKESAGGSPLNIRPRYFIVPAALETDASQLMNSTVDPTATKGQASNPVANMAEIVTDARLDAASATAWYLAADPSAFDTIEVAYLDGQQEPSSSSLHRRSSTWPPISCRRATSSPSPRPRPSPAVRAFWSARSSASPSTTPTAARRSRSPSAASTRSRRPRRRPGPRARRSTGTRRRARRRRPRPPATSSSATPPRSPATRRRPAWCASPAAPRRRSSDAVVTAFALAVSAIFDDPNMAEAAVHHRADGGPSRQVRVIRSSPDVAVTWQTAGAVTSSLVIDVPVADAPEVDRGDHFALAGAIHEVKAAPVRDELGLVWRVELREAS